MLERLGTLSVRYRSTPTRPLLGRQRPKNITHWYEITVLSVWYGLKWNPSIPSSHICVAKPRVAADACKRLIVKHSLPSQIPDNKVVDDDCLFLRRDCK